MNVRHQVGERCSTRRRYGKYARDYGCLGRLVVEACVRQPDKRMSDGTTATGRSRPAREGETPDVFILVCDRCGQAHGPAPEQDKEV